MIRKLYALLATLLIATSFTYTQNTIPHNWKAKWITCRKAQNATNSWIVARKTVDIENTFENASVFISVDSKYWLYINGELVVFEGNLKRGPNKFDTYYDKVDVSKHLKKGENTIAILYWYFGKDGFSHQSSGKAGLIFELYTDDKLKLISDDSWYIVMNDAYRQYDEGEQPNFRLSESNVVYDARKEIGDWHLIDYKSTSRSAMQEIGVGECPPWNNLIERPIPQWKDFGLRKYEESITFPYTTKEADTISCLLPYNCQFTPYFKIKAKSGARIDMFTDNYYGGGPANLRAVYFTKEGDQEYESLGWINGHEMKYVFPKGIEIIDLQFRETGYNTEFSGSFKCDNENFNKLWKKSQRTLYITMRDNYMDCPDRERAQWWGDEVNEIEESFYALCPKSHLLAKKGILELMDWQLEDGTIFSPIPSENWGLELPLQMLNSIGYYGFWTYFIHTGDTATIKYVLPKVKKYLRLWTIEDDGLVKQRKGGWTWGDWGKNKDMKVLYNCWYYLACKGYANMANILGESNEKEWAENNMTTIADNFNKAFWNDTCYKSKDYTDEIDDRANAMAVLTGMVEPEKYPAILEILKTQEYASPYMEKYVIEALFIMGYDEYALERMEKRFMPMISGKHSTLYEGWGIGSEGYGGGTYNHAWSGGGLTLLSKYVVGISPVLPGYSKIQIRPAMGKLKTVEATISSVSGIIEVKNEWLEEGKFTQNISAPENIEMIVYFPRIDKEIENVTLNGLPGDSNTLKEIILNHQLELNGGTYNIEVLYEE